MPVVPWRYTICEMSELPGAQDFYFDGIGAMELLGENIRFIPYKFAPTLKVQRVSLEFAFVRPLIGWVESLEHAQAMLGQMPVPKPSFPVKRLAAH